MSQSKQNLLLQVQWDILLVAVMCVWYDLQQLSSVAVESICVSGQAVKESRSTVGRAPKNQNYLGKCIDITF